MAADSTTQQGSSDAASPSISEEATVTIALTEEEVIILNQEVDRLALISVICRIIGLRPSRADVRDLL